MLHRPKKSISLHRRLFICRFTGVVGSDITYRAFNSICRFKFASFHPSIYEPHPFQLKPTLSLDNGTQSAPFRQHLLWALIDYWRELGLQIQDYMFYTQFASNSYHSRLSVGTGPDHNTQFWYFDI